MNVLLRWCLILVFAASLIPVYSTGAVERKTRLSAKTSFQSGNVDEVTTTLAARYTYRDSLLELNWSGYFTYGEQDNVKKQQELNGRLTADWWYDDVLSPFLFASAGFNFQRDIDLRWQLGLGGKYTFWRNEYNKASVSAAVVFDVTEYDPRALRADESTGRLSLRLKHSHTLCNDRLHFRHVTYYVPAFEDVSDYRTTSFLELGLPITSSFEFTVSFRNEFESVVAAGTEKNDARLEIGVAVGW